MSKYSGVWTPDMGEGDDAEVTRRPSPSAFYSEQFNAFRERQEERARLEYWMNGHAPRWQWEAYASGMRVFAMIFPHTVHEIAWAFEHPHEHGRILVWCAGCNDSGCNAARWTRAAFVAEIRREREAAQRRQAEARHPF